MEGEALVDVDAVHLTAGERVHAVLRERILSRQIVPGSRLVLTTIAKEFGVSITPVREALRRMEQERLVELRPSWGYRVAYPDAQSIEGLWQVREALECQAARACVERAESYHVAELEALARRADGTMGATGTSEGVEIAFHKRVAEMAGYAELAEALERVLLLLGTFSRSRFNSLVTHLDVVGAIASGDPDQAEDMMRQHVHLPTKEA